MSEIDSWVLKFDELLGLLLGAIAACRLETGGGGGTFFGVESSSSVTAAVKAGVDCCCVTCGKTTCGKVTCGASLMGTTGGNTGSEFSLLAGGGGSGLLRSLLDLCIDGRKIPR